MHDRDEDLAPLLLAADMLHELFRLALVSVAVICIFGIAAAFAG